MPTNHQAFDLHLETWKREEEMPWQRIRRIAEVSNLLRHVGKSGLKILDPGAVTAMHLFRLRKMGAKWWLPTIQKQ